MDIEEYRSMIDTVNREIVGAVARRTDLAEEIGELKEDQDLDVTDEDREKAVREQFEDLFREHDLPQDRADELADLLIAIATEAQR
jgi:chorismate mutase